MANAVATATLRVARPTNDVKALLPFYRDGLGLEVLGTFNHDGWDGALLGHSGTGYHIEFISKEGHDAGRAPTQDNLLVWYLPDKAGHEAAVGRMERAGFAAVRAFNPYWDACGKTYEDPDGYRVVLAHRESPV
jgi:hypothetical protein